MSVAGQREQLNVQVDALSFCHPAPVLGLAVIGVDKRNPHYIAHQGLFTSLHDYRIAWEGCDVKLLFEYKVLTGLHLQPQIGDCYLQQSCHQASERE